MVSSCCGDGLGSGVLPHREGAGVGGEECSVLSSGALSTQETWHFSVLVAGPADSVLSSDWVGCRVACLCLWPSCVPGDKVAWPWFYLLCPPELGVGTC